MIKQNSITLINHASVLIKGVRKTILTDPWYWGDAFHQGWSLMHENTSAEIEDILNNTSFIWVSHEHPDHFSVPFFKRYRDKLQDLGIRIIFQATKDRRVKNFVEGEGLEVIELEEDDVFEVEAGYTISIVKDDFYDSALLIQLGDKKIFNLNDCHFPDERKIKKFRNKYGLCDVLLTQFSYAAWKGGTENKKWREEAAHEKLQGVIRQCEILGPKVVIPFASFVRFSNELNNYLNDSANRPSTVEDQCKEKLKHCACAILQPMETLELSEIETISPRGDAVAFWDNKFLEPFTPIRYSTSVPIVEINNKFLTYCNRVKKNNSSAVIKLASWLPFLEIFKPVEVELLDLGMTVRINVPQGSIVPSSSAPDISLHSQSLAFIFDNSFGFDTLTVNGNFEQRSKNGFSKFTKNFAIENLNNLGYRLDWMLIFNVELIVVLFCKIVF